MIHILNIFSVFKSLGLLQSDKDYKLTYGVILVNSKERSQPSNMLIL